MRQWLSIPAGALVLVAFQVPDVGWGSVVAALLIGSVLALAVSRSTASGPGLIVTLSGLLFVSWALISIPEGVLFDVIEPGAAPVALVMALVASISAVVAVVAVSGRLGEGSAAPGWESPIRSPQALLWRLVASPALFVVCYFVAGMIIFPFVEEYYVGRVLPDPAAIVSMQVLRSLAIVGAAYPLLRTLRTRRDAVLVLAVALPVFGVLAPLLPANDLMPGGVRLVHALETLPYYALFGAVVAVWFGPPRSVGPTVEATEPLRAAAG